uniref:Chorein_N domain-containing protein n=1 Tax=Rhabditophanes sp. KR3021 TaxID=114890 RepID=A0AC35U203_9BILA
MLESLVTSLLNKYVGEYLEDLNTDQLSIAVLSGQVELENVPLKKTALRKLDIPVTVKSGVVGKLTLSIPITHLRSESWVIKLSDVLILLHPSSHSTYDGEYLEQRELSVKEHLLQELQSIHQTALLNQATISPPPPTEQQNTWWGASMASLVVNNIQLIVTNIHVQYEDDVTLPGQVPFNFGFRIEDIRVQSTGANWKTGFVHGLQDTHSFKKLTINGLSLFWNGHEQKMSCVESFADLKNLLRPETYFKTFNILKPFSLQIRMSKHLTKFPLKATDPRFSFDVTPTKLAVQLSTLQLSQIKTLTQEWARFDRGKSHRKWRPQQAKPITKQNAKVWWKFGCDRVLEPFRRRNSGQNWRFVMGRVRVINQYSHVYRQKLICFLIDNIKSQGMGALSDYAHLTILNQLGNVNESKNDDILLKQIERDNNFTFNELSSLRDYIFKKLLATIQSDTTHINKEIVKESESCGPLPIDTTTPHTKPATPSPHPRGSNLYGWISSWWGSDAESQDPEPDEDSKFRDVIAHLPTYKPPPLPPNLKKVEQQMEQDLFEALNETWDDSEIFTRDKVLALLNLHLEAIVVRFIDEDKQNHIPPTKLIAIDATDVLCRVNLSAREHRTAISLNVGDVNVRCSKVVTTSGEGCMVSEDGMRCEGSSKSMLNEGGGLECGEVKTDSIYGGFGNNDECDGQVMFAVGRSKKGDLWCSGKEKQVPFLKMNYCRLAPKQTVFHELDAQFEPVSIVYDEDAMEGISGLFDTESQHLKPQTPEDEREAIIKTIDNHFYCYAKFPVVDVELKTRRSNLFNSDPMSLAGECVAIGRLSGVNLGISKTEQFVTKYKLGIQSFWLRDMYDHKYSKILEVTSREKASHSVHRSRSSSSLNVRREEIKRSRSVESNIHLVSNQNGDTKPSLRKKPIKKGTYYIEKDFEFSECDQILVTLNKVNKLHSDFAKSFKNVEQDIKVVITDMEVGMNRRIWLLMMDFLGLMPKKPDQTLFNKNVNFNDCHFTSALEEEKVETSKVASFLNQIKEPCIMNCSLDLQSLKIFMNFPTNCLGTITMDELGANIGMDLNDNTKPMEVGMTMSQFKINNCTPTYSTLYQNVMSIAKRDSFSGGGDKISVNLTKHRTPDPRLKRAFDMALEINVSSSFHMAYLHTHRFFCGLTDFWLNFADLQDQMVKLRTPVDIEESFMNLQTRTLLNLNFNCTGYFGMPLNQFSEECLIWVYDSIKITNYFALASKCSYFDDQNIETNFSGDGCDCLMDNMLITLKNLKILEGTRISKHSKEFACLKSYLGGFDEYVFATKDKPINDNLFDLNVLFGRNLSTFISHNVPNMCAVLELSDIDLNVTTESYKLMRGFLESNLGDQISVEEDTVPIECLNRPSQDLIQGEAVPYSNMSIRIKLCNVNIHLFTPNIDTTGFVYFGKIVYKDARVGFDSYGKDRSELDLICKDVQLIDTRYDSDQIKANIFVDTLVAKPNTQESENSAEAHILMKTDEAPEVTFILINMRVLLVLDWFLAVKEFLLMTSSFEVPNVFEDVDVNSFYSSEAFSEQITPKMVALKPPALAHTMTLKLTLKETDFVVLQNTGDVSSLALIMSTTAVFNMNDINGNFSLKLNIQTMSLSWCVMGTEQQTSCPISTDFNGTFSMECENTLPLSGKIGTTVSNYCPKQPKHILKAELVDCSLRLSYKDLLILKNVVGGVKESIDKLFASNHSNTKPPPNQNDGIKLDELEVHLFGISIWFLDDFKGPALPVIKLLLPKLLITYSNNKLVGEGSVGVDYFNQRMFGWEPFVEPWKIDQLSVDFKDKLNLNINCVSNSNSTLNFNVTTQLVQQLNKWHSRWAFVKQTIDGNFRSFCRKGRTNNMSFVLKNEVGVGVYFTTDVDELIKARKENCKFAPKWRQVGVDRDVTFEFSTKRSIFTDSGSRIECKLIIQIDGWEELTPINIDSVGTYFPETRRKGNNKKETSKVVVGVTMDADGRKVISVRSPHSVTNFLTTDVLLRIDNSDYSKNDIIIARIHSEDIYNVPLNYLNAKIHFRPVSKLESREVNETPMWHRLVRQDKGGNKNGLIKYTHKDEAMYICVADKHDDSLFVNKNLPGFSMSIFPPLLVMNQLPSDVQFGINGKVKLCQAGKVLSLIDVNVDADMVMKFVTDRFTSLNSITYNRKYIPKNDGSIPIREVISLADENKRILDVYANISLAESGTVLIVLWVPFWIVNKAGIPLIVRKRESSKDAPGQLSEHEHAKDRTPLMLSFGNDDLTQKIQLRIGDSFIQNARYNSQYSDSFKLQLGDQCIRLYLTHNTEPTLIYNIGIEVKQGMGRYKDTQVVILTPRYFLINRCTEALEVCHHQEIGKKIRLEPSSNLIWNETFEDNRMVCVKREDIKHWSLPFRIDQIGSYHINMRAYDEVPHFVRVEVTLKNARFCVTFTDAKYYPPPIQIVNESDVPVLYQQFSKNKVPSHLRSICKARSVIDYAWDNLYDCKLLTLQVFENTCHSYDPSKSTSGPSLTYQNYMFITFEKTFQQQYKKIHPTQKDKHNLVFEVLREGKVVLNNINHSSQNQVWNVTEEGCLESVGLREFKNNVEIKYVLDVVDGSMLHLMVTRRNQLRDKSQIWKFDTFGRLRCGVGNKCVQYYDNSLILAEDNFAKEEEGVISQLAWNQIFSFIYQRPGSGTLDVRCLHVGPTLVVKIVDKARKKLTKAAPHINEVTNSLNFDVTLSMQKGIGISIINTKHEELIYSLMSGLSLNLSYQNKTYTSTVLVKAIQIDNQLQGSQRFHLFYCEPDAQNRESLELPNKSHHLSESQHLQHFMGSLKPALKLELKCTPKQHYDAFECLRIKVGDMSVNLDELLLWKMVEFAQESGTAESVKTQFLLQPPSTDLDTIQSKSTRKCYFGTLHLEAGFVALSVITVPKNAMDYDLRSLKKNFNVKLISFENALINLPPFKQVHYFETISFLVEALTKFYAAELKNQTLNIIVSMDAFGNPLGLATDIKDSLQTLVFEGNVSGFVSGFGYGVANSFSKVVSSMASGVGSLTYDPDHENVRRKAIKIQSSADSRNPLSHIYSGVKGLGVGVLGGFTAIASNTIKESKRSGLAGTFVGIYTGAVDTITKPVQGVFDLLEGTASAMKEVAGSGHIKKTYHPSIRTRLPRVCGSLNNTLPIFNRQNAEAQWEMKQLLEHDSTTLLDLETCLEYKNENDLVVTKALICTDLTYIMKQVNGNKSEVVERLEYKYLLNMRIVPLSSINKKMMPQLRNKPFSIVPIEIELKVHYQEKVYSLLVWCKSPDVAQSLHLKITKAKQLFDCENRLGNIAFETSSNTYLENILKKENNEL